MTNTSKNNQQDIQSMVVNQQQATEKTETIKGVPTQ